MFLFFLDMSRFRDNTRTYGYCYRIFYFNDYDAGEFKQRTMTLTFLEIASRYEYLQYVVAILSQEMQAYHDGEFTINGESVIPVPSHLLEDLHRLANE